MTQFAIEVLERAVQTPSLRELFADVRDQTRTSGVTAEELDTRIENAVKEVRKQRRA